MFGRYRWAQSILDQDQATVPQKHEYGFSTVLNALGFELDDSRFYEFHEMKTEQMIEWRIFHRHWAFLIFLSSTTRPEAMLRVVVRRKGCQGKPRKDDDGAPIGLPMGNVPNIQGKPINQLLAAYDRNLNTTGPPPP